MNSEDYKSAFDLTSRSLQKIISKRMVEELLGGTASSITSRFFYRNWRGYTKRDKSCSYKCGDSISFEK